MRLFAFILAGCLSVTAAPLRIGVVGLEHGHVAGFFSNNLKRSDIEILGIAEPDRALFDRYANQYHLDPALYFPSLSAMLSQVHPEAVVTYTNTFAHRRVVEECAAKGVHVMMEKPLAVSYEDALAMQHAAQKANIQVIVNFETTWYASNRAAYDMVQKNELGELRKVVVHDGHPGPKEIHVQPEFFAWLTNPKLNGAGALFDFGCYGADLMTWLMQGQTPESVTAITQQFKPEIYSPVDDEADVFLKYPTAVAILQASWNWPFDRKDMEVYGRTGYVKTIKKDQADVRLNGEQESHTLALPRLDSPYDDSIHYFTAVVRGEIHDDKSLSALPTNVTVVEILDAARRSASTGRTIKLPLSD